MGFNFIPCDAFRRSALTSVNSLVSSTSLCKISPSEIDGKAVDTARAWRQRDMVRSIEHFASNNAPKRSYRSTWVLEYRDDGLLWHSNLRCRLLMCIPPNIRPPGMVSTRNMRQDMECTRPSEGLKILRMRSRVL